ncbi:PspA/IM30 family protein [Nanchangia anserum]|uniref:PspA/IM30 family protein n=1 Tax=Nanchangia anserum TaxID=2692125 RepID=A0A8I0KNK4_9ACTO|nr:PspA/IM30 family protein [Nanchangia anserum]MBD3689376.1 PspA/IM30 family protein [Nanchangia anserum]QOX81583.1 PspA/IM30 family protein [Nanchangia anserum]
MAEKQTILGRVAQLAKANINALLDRAEDPEKMLDQLIRDYTNNIAEAESAIAQTIGNLRLAEADQEEDRTNAAEWGQKAQAASRRADEYRAAGETANADKFDRLAKEALRRQLDHERQASDAEPMLASQRQMVEQLKSGLEAMKAKLEELKSKRDNLVSRQKLAQAQNKLHDAMGSINVMDPTSELSRFEERVRKEEALAMGRQELESDSLEAQFAALGDSDEDAEIEARLAQLKSRSDS